MNAVEKGLLAVILACVVSTLCAQCYHAGYNKAFDEIENFRESTCSTDEECEAVQR